MSADVLCTGDNRDLLPSDRISDTERDQQLILQQADTILSIAEGEWPINILQGIDWLGYLTDRGVNVPALAQEVARTLEEIPNIAVRESYGEQSGRVITLSVQGFISQRPFQLTVLGQQDAGAGAESSGDNAILVPLVLSWGYTAI